MLTFMLQLELPVGSELPAQSRADVCDAMKLFLTSNLPLDPVEFHQSPITSAKFVAILRSVSRFNFDLFCMF